MGSCGSASISKSYSVPISQAKPGETQIFRNPQTSQALVTQPDPQTFTLQDAFLRSAKLYGDKPCFGTIEGDAYKFITYKQVLEEAQTLGSGIQNLGIVKAVKEYQHYELSMVGIFAKNRKEWMILDISNMLYGFTMIPFYDTLGAESIPFVLEQTNLETMFLSADALKSLLKITNRHKLKNLVLLDPISEEQKQELYTLQYKVFSYEDILLKGKPNLIPFAQVSPKSVYTFSYTSGTTGNPKGAMLSHANFIATLSSVQYTDARVDSNDIHISYLPLPHVMERLLILTVLYSGGKVGFYRGDPLLLKEDIAKLRPTIFMSVPRLYNKFYDGIKAKIEAVTGLKRSFADRAIRVKLENLHSEASYHDSIYDKAFQGVRDLFGGQCRLMITGSAPIQQEIIDFLKVTAGCPIYEGYGSTESTAGTFVTQYWDPHSGHQGGPCSVTEFKLVDVPEMKYTSLDIVDGRPTPRGEVCVRGPCVFLGYYKEPEKTAEAIDQEGWLHMGDIGMIQSNGSLKLIDRKKNIFKLQQGEYIAPEKLESIYNRAPGVAESFVYGDPMKNHCVGIIVPQKEYVENLGKEKNLQGTFEDLCKSQEIIDQIRKNINDFGRANKLNSLEIVKYIYLETQSFGMHDCLTTTFKLQRYKAREIFGKQIEELYKKE